jgi:hypothetical protein
MSVKISTNNGMKCSSCCSIQKMMVARNQMTKFKINGKQKKSQRKCAVSQPSQPCIQNITIDNQMCLREKKIKLH